MTRASSNIARWRRDPVTFVREVLTAEPDGWQVEVLQAAASGQKRIALKASKGPGKSTVLAWIAWWFLLTRLHPKVICTSVTADNLSDGLWTELSKWQQRSPLLRKAFTWTKTRITANDHPETWWASARTWSKDADTRQQGETLAGIHADNVLFLVDEAGGVPDAVVSAAEAGLANADESAGRTAMLVLAGNPTQTSGPLYRACSQERALWWVKEISGDPDDPKRAPRVNIDWAREQITKYGRDNPWVLVNVFGQFPPAQANTFIGVEVAAQASRRVVGEADYSDHPKILGVDVARFGDDRTVLFPRQGPVAFAPQIYRNKRTTEVAHLVAFAIEKWRPDAVFIDAGGVGAGVVDQLLELGHDVMGVESASSPLTAEPKLKNRRAEMWWLMAEWMRHGCIPDDGELIAELTTPTMKYDATSHIQLESKDDIKKRGLPSPDKADALALTFAAPVIRKFAALPGAPGMSSRPGGQERRKYDPFARL